MNSTATKEDIHVLEVIIITATFIKDPGLRRRILEAIRATVPEDALLGHVRMIEDVTDIAKLLERYNGRIT